MSKTNNLGLNKHDNVANNTNPFDIENYLNTNWDILDKAVGNIKNTAYDDTEIKKEINQLNLKKVDKEEVLTNLEIEEILKL